MIYFRHCHCSLQHKDFCLNHIDGGELTCYLRSYSFAYIQYGTKMMSSGSTQGNDDYYEVSGVSHKGEREMKIDER